MKALAVLIALGGALAAAGCGTPAGYEVVRTYTASLTVVRLRVERTRISVAQTVRVVVEADVPAGVTPRIPQTPEGGDDRGFALMETGEERPRSLRDGLTRYARWYRLEPFLSGVYRVLPIDVAIVDPTGTEQVVSTESVEVTVTSLLPADYERLDLQDIDGPLRLPWRAPPGLLVVLGILVAATTATGVWLWVQRRWGETGGPPPRPAHEIAYEEIDALIAEDLLARGEIKLFYQRVTAILRVYVERRFGLRAPERTTEEFLSELRETGLLGDDLKKLLRLFLEHADLVKFAQHRPLGDEIERTLSSCRDFVRATQAEQVQTRGV